MGNENPLITVLINNTERILDQIEQMQQTSNKQNITLDRLTSTVEVHEKRSTNLEAIQKECKIKCEADICVATAMATAAQNTLNDIKRIVKWFVWIFMVLVALIEINANIAQIWSVWIVK